MACVSLDAGDADRSKRFKHSAQATPPGAPAMFPEETSNVQFDQQDIFQGQLAPAYAITADTRSGAVEVPEQQPALAPPASTTVVPSPLALPAASQQYPVLPQAAASAAAATATAAPHGQEHPLRQHWTQADDSFAAAGKKHMYTLDPQQQQQRRRAGPANQWRPGMPLLPQQPAQPYAGPPQAAAVPSTQQLQWPPGSLAQQILQGGALGAALQKLLPLPGQLMASQQQHQSAAGPSAFSIQQQQAQQALQHQHMRPQLLLPQHAQQSAPTATQQRPLHILQGIPAALPAGTFGLVPSAPQGPQNRVLADPPGPAAAAAGATTAGYTAGDAAGAAAIGSGTATGPSNYPAQTSGPAAGDPGLSHGVSSSAAAMGGPDAPHESRAGWLKLLSCEVDPQGDSLALELLLAGQLYKGHLTRVPPADTVPAAAAPEPAAAAQVLAAASAGAGNDDGPTGGGVVEASEAAAVLDFAKQREGMCFLCALPFAKHTEGATPGQTLAQAAAVQTALANNEVGTAAAALAGSADSTGAAVRSEADDGPIAAAAAAAQSQGTQLPPQHLQQQQAGQEHKGPVQQEQQHKESSMLAALGPAVQCELGPGCCIILHQACAEASAKAAAVGPQQQQQQHEASCMQQLLACLSNQCCGCGQRAASLQCAAPGCSRMFHVPCVQGMGASLSQDGACWCSEHQHVKLQQPTAGPFAGQHTGNDAATDAAHAGLSSPEPTQAPGINPSPSFAAALVLQQMRCSTGFDVLLLGPDAQLGEPGADSSSGAGSSINAAAAAGTRGGRGADGRTRTSAHRRLLEAMPPSNGTSSTGPGPWQYSGSTARRDGSQAAGLYGSTAEASREYHLEQQQQAAYGAPQGSRAAAQRPAASMLLQRLQQQSGQTAWQRQQQQQEQQQHVGPTRRSPQSNKGRPPLHMPTGKPKGSWNTLGLVSAFALAQQQEEEARQQQEQQRQRQLAASHAAAAAVVVSGPTVVVPRVRAKKGAALHAPQY